MSRKPHPHLKVGHFLKSWTNIFFLPKKYETVMHKVGAHPWIPVPPPRACMWSPTPLYTSPTPPILPWTRQAVQSTTELAASVCSLFIFKLISVAIGTSVNLKNLFFFFVKCCWKEVTLHWHEKTCTYILKNKTCFVNKPMKTICYLNMNCIKVVVYGVMLSICNKIPSDKLNSAEATRTIWVLCLFFFIICPSRQPWPFILPINTRRLRWLY